MKFLSLVLLFFIVSCATPGVSVKYDEFKGGEVIALNQNQLDTPGFGDIYFNVEAVKNKKDLKLTVIGAVDYEVQGTANIKINKADPLSIIVDGKRIALKPIKNTYNYTKTMGIAASLHIQRQDYKVTQKQLEQIANGKVVKMKLFCSPHKDGGFVGTFEKRNFDKLKELLSKL